MTATLDQPQLAGKDDGAPSRVWTAHPLIDRIEDGAFRALSDAEIVQLKAEGWSDDDLQEHYDARTKRLRDAEEDPLLHGFELPTWFKIREQLMRKDEVYLFSANDAGKSEFITTNNTEASPARFLLWLTTFNIRKKRLSWLLLLPVVMHLTSLAQN